MFHNLPKAKDVPNSYSKEQVRVELSKLVSELDKMGDEVYAADPDMEEDDWLAYKHMSVGAILAIGHLLGGEVAAEIFNQKADEAEAELNKHVGVTH
tara:strand:+ start:352 stop:642 length:291 start_codon:yes stop_codon:yes gene_type:complete